MGRNEDQTRVELIDPALHERGWTEDLIRREKTPGGVDIVDGQPRKRRGRTDYLLCVPVLDGKPPLAIALIEAKSEDKLPSLGLQQGKSYQRRFNVPFVFSTNGHLFAEFGEDTRKSKDAIALDQFPSPDELRERYERLRGFELNAKEARPLLMPYKGGEAARYYFQDAAIRAALEKIASQGADTRILLSLATGTGKTVIATQLLYKLAEAGQLRRALFVCDRDELRTQAMAKLHGMFGDNAQIVTTSDPQLNARVLVASYQTLNIADEDDQPKFWHDNYPKNYFSHIIIDEAHRSAWGKWSVILRDNPDAVHIGLTATPRKIVGGKKTKAKEQDEAITAHNVEYFGEPVYEYSLGTGQDDGYLASCEVMRRTVDLDKDGVTKEDIEKKSATDPYTGRTVDPDEIEPAYTAKAYETKLMLPDRVGAMSADLFDLLLKTGGPHQKTIIFCARDSHATQVAMALNNLYEDWCAREGPNPREWFAFQCTGNPDLRPGAKELIADFKGSKRSHFIATTVDLLSTGVDVPNLANVVFFRYIESPISFYQMVGRGSRTGEPRGSKAMFRLYDFTNATRLFGEEFASRSTPTTEPDDQSDDGPEKDQDGQPRHRLIRVEGFSVAVQGAGHSILVERDGQEVLVPLEQYKEELADRLTEEAHDLDQLRAAWVMPRPRKKLVAALPGGEGAVRLIRRLEDQDDCDLYDVLAELGFGVAAKSRAERAAAFPYKQRRWLKGLPEKTRDVLKAISAQFEKGGIDELETETLFDERSVIDAGGFEALLRGPEKPDALIQETKEKILAQ
jgi:type I restriction enzyme, R subunit